MDNRRKYERVRLPETAQTYVLGSDGERLGLVRVLGAGGLFVETERRFPEFTSHRISLVDEGAAIHRRIIAVARRAAPDGVGFEFLTPDIDLAFEIGIIVGRYQNAAQITAA
jgi:hypothetical protein